MKKMLKITSVLAALVMSLAFLGCGNDSEDMPLTYYTVIFDANGGEGSMTEQKFTVGEAQSLQANTFTRTDYSFIVWNTKKDGSGTDYADEAIVKDLATTNGATVRLYAHWTYIGNTDNIPSNEDSDNTDDMTSNEDSDNTDSMPPNEDNGNTDNMPPNGDNDNTDDDEKPQYVWLPVSFSSHSENSNTEGTEVWVYYNNALDYKYIYESQNETQTYQGTVISKTASTYVFTERCSSANSVTTTYIYDSDGNKISDLLYQSEGVATYFEELLPRIFTKSGYQKSTFNDGNVSENNADYDLEYLGEENDCKVYKYFLNNGTSYTIYKIKDGMIQKQDHYYDDKLNSIIEYSVSSDEFLAELKFQDSLCYDANGNLTSTIKYILNSKNENEAYIDLVTSTTTDKNVTSWKYKRFMYPF